MPYQRPTLQELQERIIADIQASVGQPVPSRSVFSTLGRVFAAAIHGEYGNIAWVVRQLFPDTAESDYLDRWAAVWGLSRKPAAFASGAVTLTGMNGSSIPEGSLVQYGASQYEVQATGTIASGEATVTVEAIEAGVAGNAAEGQIVTLVSPIAGVDSSGEVATGGITGGADVESDEELRTRLFAVIREPAQGGSAADYVRWALEVPGVTRAWCIPAYTGAGSVGVLFVTDGAVDIIPSPAKVAEVDAYIELRRPVTANVITVAPAKLTVNFTIALNPNTPAVQAAVTQALTDFITEKGSPGATLYKSQIDEAISFAPGEVSHNMTVPAADVVIGPGQIAALGTITWV